MARADKPQKNESTQVVTPPRKRKAAGEMTVEVAVEVPVRKPLFDRVTAWLDSSDWRYDANPEKQYFVMPFNLKEALVRMIIDLAEADGWERVMVLVSYPVRISEDKRLSVLQHLATVNYGMVFGSFDMDLSDGEVRFRASMEADHALTDGMIDRLVSCCLGAADQHFSDLMKVIYGTPEAPDPKPVKAVNAPGSECLQ